jgi:hypothetical protein
MKDWIWRIVIIILALAIVPPIINGTASIVISGIATISKTVHSFIGTVSGSGDARLESLIKLCLYLISITILIRFLFNKKG